MSASDSALPEELWRRILEIGIESSNFNYKDLCCLSITCTLLNRLSSDDSLWSSLFFADFPQYQQPSSSCSVSSKWLYKIRYLCTHSCQNFFFCICLCCFSVFASYKFLGSQLVDEEDTI